MSENLRRYTKAMYALDAVARRVPADAWDQQSPCADWTAREVVGHVTYGTRALLARLSGGDAPAEAPEAELAGDDPCVTIGEAMDWALAELDRPGALQKVVATPFGEMPVDAMLGIVCTDSFAHTWDVAQAAGIPHGLDQGMAATLHQNLAPMADALRGPGMFGPAVEVPADADNVTQLMGFLGRSC